MTSKIILIKDEDSLKRAIIDWDKDFYRDDFRVARRGHFNLETCRTFVIEWCFERNIEIILEKKKFYNVFRRMVKKKEIDWVTRKNKFRSSLAGSSRRVAPSYLFNKYRHGILRTSPLKKDGWYFHNDKALGDNKLVAWMIEKGLETLDDPADMLAAKIALGTDFEQFRESALGDITIDPISSTLWVFDGSRYQQFT